MTTIITSITTQDARRQMEKMARDHGYRLQDWLEPREAGDMKVVASLTVDGKKHTRGFAWDGRSINDLAVRCMALDVTMQGLPSYLRSMTSIRRSVH